MYVGQKKASLAMNSALQEKAPSALIPLQLSGFVSLTE